MKLKLLSKYKLLLFLGSGFFVLGWWFFEQELLDGKELFVGGTFGEVDDMQVIQ